MTYFFSISYWECYVGLFGLAILTVYGLAYLVFLILAHRQHRYEHLGSPYGRHITSNIRRPS
jgi:hypothetical protein